MTKLLDIIYKNIFNYLLIIIVKVFLLMLSWFGITLLNILFDLLILPIVLVYLNYISNLDRKDEIFFKNFIPMAFVIVFSNFLGYTIWGISTGYFFNPDSETVLIFESITIFGLIFLLILSIGAQVNLTKNSK